MNEEEMQIALGTKFKCNICHKYRNSNMKMGQSATDMLIEALGNKPIVSCVQCWAIYNINMLKEMAERGNV